MSFSEMVRTILANPPGILEAGIDWAWGVYIAGTAAAIYLYVERRLWRK